MSIPNQIKKAPPVPIVFIPDMRFMVDGKLVVEEAIVFCDARAYKKLVKTIDVETHNAGNKKRGRVFKTGGATTEGEHTGEKDGSVREDEAESGGGPGGSDEGPRILV